MRKEVCTAFGLLALASAGLAAEPRSSVDATRDMPAEPEPARECPATLELLSGETWRGTLLGIEAGQGVSFRHPLVKERFTVQLAALRSIRFQSPGAVGVATNDCRVTLSNGDKLAGSLAALDESALVLHTWYGGTLTLPRKLIQTVAVFTRKSRVIYQGPNGLEGWTQGAGDGTASRGAGGGQPGEAPAQDVAAAPAEGGSPAGVWKSKEQGLQAVRPGAIGRDVRLTPVSSLEFDCESEGARHFSVLFYAEDFTTGPQRRGYQLQFNGREVTLAKNSPTSGARQIGTALLPAAVAEKLKFRVCLRSDRLRKTVALSVDGAMVWTWEDSADSGSGGTSVVFWQQSSELLRLSNIRVVEWESPVEENIGSVAASPEDALILRNRDRLSGHLKFIRDGQLELQTSFARIELALDQISHIALAQPTARTNTAPALAAGTALLHFKDVGRLTFKVENWKDEKIEGTSPVFGPCKLAVAAFRRIEFKP